MGYENSFVLQEALGTGLLSGLISGVPSFVLSVATYILTALALYAIAKRRGIAKPWLAWIPVVNVWLIGSISDQYRYVVKGENRSKRKALLILNIINTVLAVLVIVLAIRVLVGAVRAGMYNNMSEEAAMMQILSSAIAMVCAIVIMMGTSIATTIVRYIAMYDVYTSLDPGNNVLYLVLSILFSVTEPFFLFFNRNKDQGMPPRKEEPVYMPPVEPWEANNKEF